VIGSTPVECPAAQAAPALAVVPGHAYWGEGGAGATPRFAAGEKLVLTTDGGRLELLGQAAMVGVLGDGVYLDAGDLAKLSATTNSQVHTYGNRDTLEKVKSFPGLVLLVGTVAGVITAAVALATFFFATPDTSAIDSAGAAVARAHQSFDQIQPGSSFDATRRVAASQLDEATNCIDHLAGRSTPSVSIKGISCTSAKKRGFAKKENREWLVAVIGLIVASATLVAAAEKSFGFQKSPG
jgi:hypothetical protein